MLSSIKKFFSRKRSYFIVMALSFIVTFVVVVPTMQLGSTTNISTIQTEILREPTEEFPFLMYEWTGEVVKNCPVIIERELILEDSYVLPRASALYEEKPIFKPGITKNEVSISVPEFLSPGPMTYVAYEIPQCSWAQSFVYRYFTSYSKRYEIARVNFTKS